MQSATLRYHGTFNALRSIYKKEGFKYLYAGLTPTVLSYLTDRAIWFSTYERLKSNIATQYTSKDLASVQVLSVIMASLVSDLVTTPLWVIRTRMMTQSKTTKYFYTSIFDAVRSIYRSEGFFAFYKGFIPSLIGVTHPMIQFPLYERLKILFHAGDPSEMNHFGILTSSALSKMIAGLITYPHEVIRTRLQTQITLYIPNPPFDPEIIRKRTFKSNSMNEYSELIKNKPTLQNIPLQQKASSSNPKSPISSASTSSTTTTTTIKNPSSQNQIIVQKYRGLWGTARVLIQEEGWKSLYRGLGTNMIRTVPSTAVSLWVFEWLRRDLG